MRQPDFQRNTLRALHGQVPERPCLFELFLNDAYYRRLAGRSWAPGDEAAHLAVTVEAMRNAGYDYASTHASGFGFPARRHQDKKTISLNDGAVITDWESFEAYPWQDPARADYSRMDTISQVLPEGMKLMVYGPGGVLENIITLMGYDNLCFLLADEPELVQAVADKVGEGLLGYYRQIADADAVGFLCSNDDWGFNTQTFLSPADMRKYIFPWHKRIVSLAHAHGKPCILHSCGYFGEVIEDVITDMGFDGRHSYEDNIMPVEDAYEVYHGRIAILGGMDMNLMTAGTPAEIYARATAMLERTAARGGYLLGTGNSVPEYVPFENFMALSRAADDFAGRRSV